MKIGSILSVHPVLEWHLAEIWDFLRCLKIPYFPLYEMGGKCENGGKENRRKSLNRDNAYLHVTELGYAAFLESSNNSIGTRCSLATIGRPHCGARLY